MDLGGTRTEGTCKDASSPWAPEASLLACGSLPTTVRLPGGETFIYSAAVWRGSVGHDEGGQAQDVKGRKESS
jgi:hypothetical protein